LTHVMRFGNRFVLLCVCLDSGTENARGSGSEAEFTDVSQKGSDFMKPFKLRSSSHKFLKHYIENGTIRRGTKAMTKNELNKYKDTARNEAGGNWLVD